MPELLDNPLYALVHLESEGDWLHLSRMCGKYLTGHDFSKLYTYLKDDAKTAIIEKSYIDKDYRDTFSNFYSKKFVSYPSTTYRLHFFRSIVAEQNLFDLEPHSKDYIGFTVVRPTQVNSIGRTILDPSKITNLQGLICRTGFKVHLNWKSMGFHISARTRMSPYARMRPPG
jgi:hypothetical protein